MSDSEIPNAELPDEIIKDIFSRLPVKSLLQFMCVSKQWRNIIEDTHFIESHLKRAAALSSHHRILVPVIPPRSLNYNISPYDVNASIEIDCPFLKPRSSIKIVGSCNGLVCLIDSAQGLTIYNPSTRKCFNPSRSAQKLLYCSNDVEFVYGFGCGSSPDDMRVYRFPRFARNFKDCNFTARGVVDRSWMRHVVSSRYDFIDTAGTFLNGSLHWLAHHSDDNSEHRVVASFNLSDEKFRDLSVPSQVGLFSFYILGALQGCLFALCDDKCYLNVEIWLMKEYGVIDSWSKFIKIPRHTRTKAISYMTPLTLINDDEILLGIDLQSFVIYNFKTETFRHFMDIPVHKWIGDAKVYVESLVSPQV